LNDSNRRAAKAIADDPRVRPGSRLAANRPGRFSFRPRV
jgi:hypothetical protein